jgi:hypothetical protein
MAKVIDRKSEARSRQDDNRNQSGRIACGRHANAYRFDPETNADQVWYTQVPTQLTTTFS